MKSSNLVGRLLCGTVLSGALLATATPALAQDVEGDTADEDRIVVTGSRIPRAGFDTLQPATVIDSEYLEKRAFSNVADAINQLPAFGIPGAANVDDQDGSNIGQNFVNFFGLGSQRTLTLVNGRRFVSSNPPSPFADAASGLQVDLNNIPIGLIERVETVAIGGAPIYGADAIAGTVNIILKDDFEGMEYQARYGTSEQGDARTYQARGLIGGNFDEGRGNAVISFEYNKEEGLIQNEREFTRLSGSFQPGSCGNASDGTPFARCFIQDPRVHSIVQGGIPAASDFIAVLDPITNSNGDIVAFAPDGTLQPFDPGTLYGAVFSQGGDGLSLADVSSLKAPIERYLVNGFANYDITDNVTAFLETFYANSRATEQVNQPGTAYNTWIFGPGDSGQLIIPLDNPFLTDQARGILMDNGITDTFTLSRASTDLLDSGPEANEVNVFRYVGGFKGDFNALDRNFTWDFSFNWGRSVGNAEDFRIFDEAFYNALDAVVDPMTGDIVCNVTLNPPSNPADPFVDGGDVDPAVDGCVPLNLFGEGAPSADAIAFVTRRSTSRSELQQQVVEGNVATELFELPAGPIGVAAGFAVRKEKGLFTVGGFAQAPFSRSSSISDIGGQFKSFELYTEAYIPLISPDMNVLGLDGMSLSIEGAFRRLDNDFAGTDSAWTGGGRFAPIPDIEFRGNYTKSVRAPAIVELFQPIVQSFSFAADPCDSTNINENPTRLANCSVDLTAAGQDPQNFQSNVLNATAVGRSGGNPNLANEIANAWTVGAILRPRFVEGLELAVDWIDVDLTNAIESATLTNILEGCYDSTSFPTAPFCQQFSRDSMGQIDDFLSGFANLGFKTFSGLQANLSYNADLNDFFGGSSDYGTLNVTGNLFYLNELNESFTGSDLNIEKGEFDDPELRGQVNLNYQRGPLDVFWQTRYISDVEFNVESAESAQNIAGVGDYWTHNAAIGYTYKDNYRMQISVNNVFDRSPDEVAAASGSALFLYDVLGRYYTFTVRASF